MTAGPFSRGPEAETALRCGLAEDTRSKVCACTKVRATGGNCTAHDIAVERDEERRADWEGGES